MTATRGTAIDPNKSIALRATLKQTVIDLTFVGVLVIIPFVDEDFVLDLLVGPACLECQCVGS
jgi:hypothetical protein